MTTTQKKPPTLDTERLKLRPFDLSDAKDVQRLAGDKAIADNALSIPHPYTEEMAEQWIRTHRPKFKAGELCNFAITLRADRDLVGAIGLIIEPGFDRAEMGYWIGKSFWNHGYCTEAGRAVIHYGFSILNLNRIHASHFIRNPASGRVMQKLAMRHEGQHEKREIYGVSREEWQK